MLEFIFTTVVAMPTIGMGGTILNAFARRSVWGFHSYSFVGWTDLDQSGLGSSYSLYRFPPYMCDRGRQPGWYNLGVAHGLDRWYGWSMNGDLQLECHPFLHCLCTESKSSGI